MNWKKTKGQEEWVSGSFKIRKHFRYFKLWFSGNLINQFNTLDLAKQEAEKITSDE
jgi:hypothetical protein